MFIVCISGDDRPIGSVLILTTDTGDGAIVGVGDATTVGTFVVALPLNLNTGFGMDTVCVFGMGTFDGRLSAVPVILAAFALARSSAVLVIFFGCTSAARSL